MRRSWQFFLLSSLVICVLGWNTCNQTQPVKPYNLVLSTDGADPNGFMLNALWGAQLNGLQGNTPGPGPVPQPSPNEPWSSSQTDWNVGFERGLFCGDHRNWVTAGPHLFGGSYTGFLSFESHSDAHPFNDDDYSFNLVPFSLTGGPAGAGLQAHEDHIHVEYDVSEVGDQFGDKETPWWHQFHHAIDNSGDRPTPWEMLTSRTATVVGLMGMDTFHPPPQSGGNGGETELHPVWAMAVRVLDHPNREEGSVIFPSADETYAFMARNRGNEGYCASADEWVVPVKTLAIKIPWRQGATRADFKGEFSIVNPPDSNHLENNVSVSVVQGSGIWLTFQLIPQPDEDGTVTEGELYVHWTGGLVNSPAAPPPPKPNGENTSDAGVMRQLAAKMTPQQRASFIAATAMKPLPKHSFSAQLKPAVQLTAPPPIPQSAPSIQHMQSPRLAQLERSRMEALHAIFGPSIPGVVDKPQAGPH